MIRLLSVSAVGLTLLIVTQARATTPLYKIKDLTPVGYTTSVAYDINSSGDAVGVAGRFPGGTLEEAYFFYDHSEGTSTVFGVGTVVPRDSPFAGTSFRRVAINDSGSIAGSATFVGGSPQTRGFIYSGSTFVNLGTLFLGAGTGSNIRPDSGALDINSSGVATGTASSGAATSDNVDIYTGTAAPITDIDLDLTALTKGDRGRAINNAGLIAGSNQDFKATLFSGASETVLLAGTALASASSFATDLNEVGQVTGETLTNASFIYDTTDSSLRVLPNLGTGGRVAAKAINESGDAVGWGDRDSGLSGQTRGFVHVYDDNTSYILEDHVVDLTVPAVSGLGDWERLRTAWGINDDGWIVGEGERRFTGETFPNDRAYLLIPTVIPEPTAVSLLLVASVGVSACRKQCN